MEGPQSPDPATDARPVLRRKGDPRMLDALGCQPKEILIMRAEDPTELSRPPEVVEIGAPQQTQVPDGDGINSGEGELTRHLCRYVLVEVKPDLAQMVVPRPWDSKRRRQISACSALARISESIAGLFW